MELESDSQAAMVDTIEKLRGQVMTMLSDGISADDLAFALAFVATEMSMQLLKSPTAAFPVVLHGIATAAFAKSRQDAPESNGSELSEEIDLDQSVGVTLH